MVAGFYHTAFSVPLPQADVLCRANIGAVLICVHCHSPLRAASPDEYSCTSCSATFQRDRGGYFSIMQEQFDVSGTPEDYASHQHDCGHAVVEFLLPLLKEETCQTLLDVGCGVGASAAALTSFGFQSYGVDLPDLSRFWAAAKHDRDRFFGGSALSLPFADNSFDFVYSLGVIEHMGTVFGHCTLAPDYWSQRQRYADEIIRVTRPGGRILIACPNKSFPVDIQHGPGDMIEKAGRIRSFIFNRTGVNVHQTWGRYHLLSYAEVKRLFKNNISEFTALPLRNYFQFARFKKGFLKPFSGMAEYWVNNLPAFARKSFLNPYLIVEMRKSLTASAQPQTSCSVQIACETTLGTSG